MAKIRVTTSDGEDFHEIVGEAGFELLVQAEIERRLEEVKESWIKDDQKCTCGVDDVIRDHIYDAVYVVASQRLEDAAR